MNTHVEFGTFVEMLEQNRANENRPANVASTHAHVVAVEVRLPAAKRKAKAAGTDRRGW